MNENKYNLAAQIASLVEDVDTETATSALRIVMMERIQDQAIKDQDLLNMMMDAENGGTH